MDGDKEMAGEQLHEMMSFLEDYNVKMMSDDKTTIDIIGDFLDKLNGDGAFFIVDLGKIIKQYERWNKNLPYIRPYYAIKCNPNNAIIQILSKLGAGFDCASKNEISQVLGLGACADDIIFANPVKESSQIKYARAQDIDMLTFDSESELYKIKLYHPNAKLLIRIKIDDSKSMCKFSCKFGVDLDDVKNILTLAKLSDLNLVGVSFHVGSNCKDLHTYYNAISEARKTFDMAKELGFEMNILDIGGGFPGDAYSGELDTIDENAITFENIARIVTHATTKFFNKNDYPDLKIIAEPGRYFAHSSHTLVLNITGKKMKKDKDTGNISYTYYLNDGVYGSFNCIIYDHSKPIIQPYNERDGILYDSIIFGPTCDSFDTITSQCRLPDLAIGEWVFVEDFGAYTTAAATTFNGFQHTPCHYIIKYKKIDID